MKGTAATGATITGVEGGTSPNGSRVTGSSRSGVSMTVGKVMRGIVLPGGVADIRAAHPSVGWRLPIAGEFGSLAPYP